MSDFPPFCARRPFDGVLASASPRALAVLRWSNVSHTGSHCPCPYCPLAAPSPPAQPCKPPVLFSKSPQPLPLPRGGVTHGLPAQPRAPWGGTAPWLWPRVPSGPSVPPAPLLLFSSVCCFALRLLVLPGSFSRQEPRGSHHGALISLRDSSCRRRRIKDALLKAPKSFSSGRKLMFTLKKPFAEGQRHDLC